MENLLIVESPSKAKTLTKYLGKDFNVIASYGHIRDLSPKEGAVDIEDDFKMKYELIQKNKKYLELILDAVKKTTSNIYLATDPDREGEAIAWHVASVLLEKKLVENKKISRVIFFEITKKAILSAVSKPRDISMHLVNAQQARRALDHLVGFNLSPILWKKIGRNLSAGRVQSPALKMIVEREMEIEKFQKEEYWSIHLKINEHVSLLFNLNKIDSKKFDPHSIKTENEKDKLLESVINVKTGEVTSINQKPRSRSSAPPFTTSTMQQESIKKLGFTAKQTMILAQQLYEGIEISGENIGLITYMRTDSVNISADFIKDLREFIKKNFGDNYIPKNVNSFQSKIKNAQEAHEAIRPTSLQYSPESIKSYLNEAQFKIYELIWRRTLASQMSKAELLTTTVEVSVDNFIFTVSGQVTKFDGFTKLYNENKDGEINLPSFKLKDSLSIKNIYGSQHFTQAPPRFSEALLVKRLEEYGIGRPSTYASIISTLQDRGYATLANKRFVPSDKGRMVCAYLNDNFNKYIDYNFTAQLETELDDISNGSIDWKNTITDFWNEFSKYLQGKETSIRGILLPKTNEPIRNWKDFSYASEKNNNDKLTFEKCPDCNADLCLQNSSRGLFVGCSAYPDCKFTEPFGYISGLKEPLVLGEIGSKKIFLASGPYGPYVQLGELVEGEKKPKRVSWPIDTLPLTFDDKDFLLEKSTFLLSLPLNLGINPKNNLPIEVSIGRFGPYIKHDDKFKSIPKSFSIFDLSLSDAIAILEAPGRVSTKGKEIGKHPKDDKPIVLKKGKFGNYISYKSKNYSLPKDLDDKELTLEKSIEIIKEKSKTKKKK